MKRKRLFVILTLCSATLFTLAQEGKTDSSNSADALIYSIDEEKAQFPGGEAACFKFIKENLKYPAICIEQGIQARVLVSFTVEKDGSLSDIKTLRSPDPNLTKEAERIVGLMPKWKPARQGNKTVRSKYILPVIFRLNADEPQKTDTVKTDIAMNNGTPDAPENDNDDRIFDVVETEAQFPGGDAECMKWLNSHVKYPQTCIEQGIEGRVSVSFIVDKDGSITDVKVVRSPNPALANEMVRLVTSMPKWIPAKQGNKIVRSRFIQSMMFSLH